MYLPNVVGMRLRISTRKCPSNLFFVQPHLFVEHWSIALSYLSLSSVVLPQEELQESTEDIGPNVCKSAERI